MEQQLQQQGREELELVDATTYGLESLRMFEGMGEQPHAAGAIVNPAGYRDPAKKSAPPPATVPFAAKGGLLSGGVRKFEA